MRSLKKKNRRDRNGLKVGYWEDYHDNGKLWYKGSYKDGERDGYWIFYYYFSGDLHSKGNYVNGIKEGEWEYYYEKDGSLCSKGNYVNGYQDGLWGFYTDNVLVRTTLYKDDKIIPY
jgi:antitoxin component YwqK of YwqJK toxin-antitoxin module